MECIANIRDALGELQLSQRDSRENANRSDFSRFYGSGDVYTATRVLREGRGEGGGANTDTKEVIKVPLGTS